MSEIEQPRNEAGQFTGEEKFGRAAELDAAGYKEMAEAPQDEPMVYGGDEDAIRAAADELASGRESEEPDPIEYRTHGGTGDLIDEKEAVSLEKATRDLSAFHDNTVRYVDGVAADTIADVVDVARAEALKNDPRTAEAYGLDPADVAAKAKTVEDRAKEGTGAEENPASNEPAEPSIDGLDPEVQKALKHPQVRQAIEEELGKASAVQQQYAQQLAVAAQIANHDLLSIVPVLQQLPQEQWPQALNILREAQPETFARAKAVIERGAQAELLQLQHARQQTVHRQQQFDAYAKAEDAKFEALVKDTPLTKEEGNALVEYAGKLGVDQPTLFELMKNNPVMRHSAFQKMMVDAARYHLLTKAPLKAVPKGVPPVARPGTGQARVPAGAEDLGALSARLSATGSIDDALKVLGAQRAARR